MKRIDTSALEAFQAKYGVTFARETFTASKPDDNGLFILRPDRPDDSLPPVGCFLKLHGYGSGQTWKAVVIAVDEQAGTYTAKEVTV